ncbi:MAG: hypothetical protein EXR51_06845 [Dehalococcoidia bacterium]|nr:hypothetical protein [Dehalococcoidia bacterium]
MHPLLGRLLNVIGVATLLAAAIPLFSARASNHEYEVWAIDQADPQRGGAKLYVYQGAQFTDTRYAGTPQVVDLIAAAQGVGDGPGVRPHLITFNSTHSHALIAYVASGHVQVMRTSDKKIVASIDVGDQAHAAMAAPDDSLILVANQNGKKLARITSNFRTETFTYNPADDLDLRALENPGFPDNAPICPLMFAEGTKKSYVTLRGGGFYAVDAGATPMRVLQRHDKDRIAPAGCGGVQVGSKIYVNSGTLTSSDLYVLDARTDAILKHIPFTPVGRDGHGMVVMGRYLWMGNRASANIAVVDTTTDANIAVIPNTGIAPDLMDISPDGSKVFATLRGPNNLTGGPPAKGQTPGFAVFRPDLGGASGTRLYFVPIGDQSVDTPSDPHAIAVRRGASAPAALPNTGDNPAGAIPLALVAGAAMLLLGVRLRRRAES